MAPHRIGKPIDRNFFSTPSIESQRAHLNWLKRFERKVKLLHVLVREIVIVRDTRGARFLIKPDREMLSQRVHSPAGTRSRFENGHVVTQF